VDKKNRIKWIFHKKRLPWFIFILTTILGSFLYWKIYDFLNEEKAKVIKENKKDTFLDNSNGLTPAQRKKHFLQHQDKIQNAARREKLGLTGRMLRPAVRPDLRQERRLPTAIDEKRLKFLPVKSQDGARQPYKEVENVKAVKLEYRDQFDEDEILDEKLNRIFVLIKENDHNEYKGEMETKGTRVAYNTRTKQLGVITGKMVLRFKSKEAFALRQKFYPDNAQEDSVFNAIHLVVIDFKSNLSLVELLNLELKLNQHEEIKRAKVEIIETERNVK